MKYLLAAFPVTCCLVIACSAPIHAQPVTQDATLALLRGTWQYHTYEDRWTLEFRSDTEIFIDGSPARYALVGDLIHFTNSKTDTEYRYKLLDDHLEITYSSGDRRTYSRAGDGRSERFAEGIYYAVVDTDGLGKVISLKNGKEAFLSPVDKLSSAIQGVYRVEGNDLLLTFDDGRTEMLAIRIREEDRTVTSIMFRNELYEREFPVAQLPTLLPVTSCPDPCCGPIIIVIPDTPPAAVVQPVTTPQTPKVEAIRDFGSTRGGKR